MRVRASSSSRLSLARQLLVFQLCLIAVVLVAVTAISIEQSRSSFVDTQQRRMLAVAEYSAANPLLRDLLSRDTPRTDDLSSGARTEDLTGSAANLLAATGVDELLVIDPTGVVLAAAADPRLLGTTVPAALLGTRPRSWAGMTDLGIQNYVAARVPILSETGAVLGAAVAARSYPSPIDLLSEAVPNLLAYLGVAGILGTVGSWLLAARVKGQTLGLEPAEIGRLVEHREALLYGIRDGVISIDSHGIVTLANDSAHQLLGLTNRAVGSSIHEMGLDPGAVRLLSGEKTGSSDIPFVNNGVLLVLNQFMIDPPRSRPEVVSTLRDLTELVTLQSELGSSRQATEALRAQAHEFSNRLHTISVLIQLGDAPSAADYIDTVTRDRSLLDHSVLTRIEEPAVAAILVAKASLARERGATLTVSPAAALPRVSEGMALDLVTVIGNLVDNSLDAVTTSAQPEVQVDIRLTKDGDGAIKDVTVVVRDTGAGIDIALGDRVFEVGVSSKAPGQRAEHGYGLAIVQLIVSRRGGRVTYTNESGTTFTAQLPEACSADSRTPTQEAPASA